MFLRKKWAPGHLVIALVIALVIFMAACAGSIPNSVPVTLPAPTQFLFAVATNFRFPDTSPMSIVGFKVDSTGAPISTGQMVTIQDANTSVSIGSDPKGRFLFALLGGFKNDLTHADSPSLLKAFRIDANSGMLTEINGSPFTLSSDPIVGLVAHPTANFLYAEGQLNGQEGIVIIQFDGSTGALIQVSLGKSGGVSKLVFAPDGSLLFAAYGVAVSPTAVSESIASLKTDPITGALSPTGQVFTVPLELNADAVFITNMSVLPGDSSLIGIFYEQLSRAQTTDFFLTSFLRNPATGTLSIASQTRLLTVFPSPPPSGVNSVPDFFLLHPSGQLGYVGGGAAHSTHIG